VRKEEKERKSEREKSKERRSLYACDVAAQPCSAALGSFRTVSESVRSRAEAPRRAPATSLSPAAEINRDGLPLLYTCKTRTHR